MNILEFFKLLIPPVLIQYYYTLRNKEREPRGIYLEGDYASWADALDDSDGYDTEIILTKTIDALMKVKDGSAIYERDSVLFNKIQYAWPLLSGLMWIAARSGGRLNVLDFGGSLGSTYFQNRRFLQTLPSVRWNIVEQPEQVKVGKANFEDEHLKFYNNIETCLLKTQPNAIILSSVLQYLEQPVEILRTLLASPCNYLILDRTPFWEGETNRLCVQHVPSDIYEASYPSWIFSRSEFRALFTERWFIIAEFDNSDKLPGPVSFSYRGMIIIRRELL